MCDRTRTRSTRCTRRTASPPRSTSAPPASSARRSWLGRGRGDVHVAVQRLAVVLPRRSSPELALLATPAGVVPLGVAPLSPLRVGGRVPPVLACLSLALPAFAGTLECPPESVRVGPACIDKYEASVWNIPA